jgi:hypothetical protein
MRLDEDGHPAPAPAEGGFLDARAVSLTRLGAALRALAVDPGGPPGRLLDFLRRIVAQSAQRPSGFETWLPGALVVELSRNALGGTTLRLLAETGARFVPVLAVLYPHLTFDQLAERLESEPERVRPAFISIQIDRLELSIVSYVDETGSFPAATAARRGYYDEEITVVAPPSRELLRASRPDREAREELVRA